VLLRSIWPVGGAEALIFTGLAGGEGVVDLVRERGSILDPQKNAVVGAAAEVQLQNALVSTGPVDEGRVFWLDVGSGDDYPGQSGARNAKTEGFDPIWVCD